MKVNINAWKNIQKKVFNFAYKKIEKKALSSENNNKKNKNVLRDLTAFFSPFCNEFVYKL